MKKIKKIDKLENENRQLLELILQLQTEHNVLAKNMNNIKENMSVVSSMMTEQAVIQNFLTDQAASTYEMVSEIDKLLHPNSYLKYDLTNEPYN